MYKCLVIAPYMKFKQNVEELAKAFPFVVDIEIGSLVDGPALARKATEEEYDVIVSRGGTSRSIQKHCSIPVVEIKITSQDILQSLIQLKKFHGKMGIIGYSNVVHGVRMVADLLDMEIHQFTIKSEKEIDVAIHQAKRLGIEIIIGDALAVKKADKYGVEAVLIPSGQEAILEALKEVETMIHFHDRKVKQDEAENVVCNMTFDQFIVRCSQMKKIISSARKVSGASSPILIYGKHGTGKSSLAQAIHNESRAQFNFITLDCGKYYSTEYLEMLITGTSNQLSLFEVAHLGTLYFKNINHLPRKIQNLIFELIYKMPFHIRFIASSTEPLDQCVQRGDFCKPLFDYFNIYRFQLPPLCERDEDIIQLSKWFLALSSIKLGKQIMGFDDEILAFLKGFNWPENVRQLETIIDQMCFISNGPLIKKDEVNYLLHTLNQGNESQRTITLSTTNKMLEEIEMEIIFHVLKEEDYNQTWASKRLGIDRTTLWRKLKSYQKIKGQWV